MHSNASPGYSPDFLDNAIHVPSDNGTSLPPSTTADPDGNSTSGPDGPAAGLALQEAVPFSILMSLCICATVVGNILVILSVFTYRPLKGVQNFFIVSLAVADLAVALLVMPFNIVNFVLGRWVFGAVFCNMWLTFDILTCTASILNLCAIAIDRYYAIHDPISYAQKRTLKRVLISIAIVWVASGIISIPPLIGWNNSGGNSLYDDVHQTCMLTNEKGFVIYSASGSFFIPLVIMTFVYVNIFRATRRRLRNRAKAAAAARVRTPPAQSTVATSHRNCVKTTSTDLAAREPSSTDSPEESHEPTADLVPRQSKASPPLPSQQHLTVPQLNNASPCLVGVPSGKKKKVRHSGSNGSELSYVEGEDTCKRRCDNGNVCPVGGGGGNTAARKSSRGRSSGGSSQPSQMYQFLEERQRISLSKERRAARTMAIIMGAFVACWLPFFLMYVIFPFCEACAEKTDERVVNFIVWLGYVNSTLNPIIYTIFNVDFRRAFKNLLLGKCRI